jgi:hypothetical protein
MCASSSPTIYLHRAAAVFFFAWLTAILLDDFTDENPDGAYLIVELDAHITYYS